MKDKERLKEIKKIWETSGFVSRMDFYWLTEQAEKVEQLQQGNENLKRHVVENMCPISNLEFISEQLQQAQEKINRLEEWDAIRRDKIVQLEDGLEETKFKAELYENALREIDTHIRSTSEPIPYIIQTLKETLPEYK
jgi:predicted RNase H-like nuclease (RuvC/YqgF family)